MTAISSRPVRVLRIAAVSDRVGLSRSVLYVMIKAGSFPKSIPLNDKTVGWLESEIDDWIASRVAVRDAAQSVAGMNGLKEPGVELIGPRLHQPLALRPELP